MKNKVLRVVLIALVLAVWGAVIKRAFVRPEVLPDAAPALSIAAVQPTQSDTTVPRYVLARDPFLDGGATVTLPGVNSTRSTAPRPQQASVVAVRTPSTPWPSITINGILRATDGAQYIATATINGKGHVLRPGQRAGEVLVQAITRDSVRLELDGNQRSLPASAGW